MKPLPKNCSLVFGADPGNPEGEPAWFARYEGGTVPELVGPFGNAVLAQERAYDLWGPEAQAKAHALNLGPEPSAGKAAKAWRAEKNGLPLFAETVENELMAKAEQFVNSAKRIRTARTNGSGPLALARELEAAGTFNGLPLETARANYYLGLLRAEELLGKAK